MERMKLIEAEKVVEEMEQTQMKSVQNGGQHEI